MVTIIPSWSGYSAMPRFTIRGTAANTKPRP